MELDRTTIVIRQRSLSEVADLAVMLISKYWRPLCLCWLVGVLPFALLNGALVGWIPLYAEWEGLLEDERFYEHARYIWLMSLLVYLQAPWAGMYITAWLGSKVFEQFPSAKEVRNSLRATSGRRLWALGIKRGPLLLVLSLLINWGGNFSIPFELLFPIGLLLLVGVMRTFRPFVPEIIILEQSPLKSKPDGGGIALSIRSSQLHAASTADPGGRSILTIFIVVPAAVAVFFTLMLVRSFVTVKIAWTWDVYVIVVPLALWIVMGICTVVRFLNYIDTRIRLEGWEVDLTLRAEAARWEIKDPNALAPDDIRRLNEPRTKDSTLR
jgi:hypothetical protein